MDVFDKFREILSKVTYKPGWSFELLSYPELIYKYEREVPRGLQYRPLPTERSRYLVITFMAPDVDTGKPLKLRRIIYISEYAFGETKNPEHVIIDHFIFRSIREFEDHEIKEWFKIDGIQVYAPHPELKQDSLGTAKL